MRRAVVDDQEDALSAGVGRDAHELLDEPPEGLDAVLGFAAVKEPGAACVPGGQVRRRFVFLDPRAEPFYGYWERVAGECVAILRWAAGRHPDDRDLSDLLGELAAHSEAFRTRWAAPEVRTRGRSDARPISRILGWKLALGGSVG